MWVPLENIVRDLRVYVASSFHGQGYGHAVVSFVKAFFFPCYLAGDDRLFSLPFGGARAVRRFSVLPVTAQAKKFYAAQGFSNNNRHESKWLFSPKEVTAMLDEPLDETLGLGEGVEAEVIVATAPPAPLKVENACC